MGPFENNRSLAILINGKDPGTHICWYTSEAFTTWIEIRTYVQINFTSYEFFMSGSVFPLIKNVNLAFRISDPKSVVWNQTKSYLKSDQKAFLKSTRNLCSVLYRLSWNIIWHKLCHNSMVKNESALDSIANFYALKYLTYGLSGISNRPNKSCNYTDRAVVDTH